MVDVIADVINVLCEMKLVLEVDEISDSTPLLGVVRSSTLTEESDTCNSCASSIKVVDFQEEL